MLEKASREELRPSFEVLRLDLGLKEKEIWKGRSYQRS